MRTQEIKRGLIQDAHVLVQDIRMRDKDGVWSATATAALSVRFTAGNSVKAG